MSRDKDRYDLKDKDDIDELKEKIHNNTRLVISRVPVPTKKAFKDLAKAEFEDDYGMCLKWCFDMALVYNSVIKRIEKLEDKLDLLKDKEKTENLIQTVGGTTIEKEE